MRCRFLRVLPIVLFMASVCQSWAAPQTPPNVVLITIDTLRADHLGCYGDKQIKTPNIDALAAEATRFERAYTPVPVTLPSHTAMLTGTYPMRSGMHDFAANKLSPDQPTLASVLKKNGYTTGAVIGSAVLDSRFGLNQGFDFYYDHFDFSRLEEANLDEMERPGNFVADQALEWLATQRGKPFFLWMHLYDPHYPYRPPEPFAREYKDRPYDGEIAFADAQVGRLLDYLKSSGTYKNTIIVLAGDHGESLGEHGEKTHGFFIYNATLHVPLIVHLPGQTGARTDPNLVSLVDLTPTVLSALRIAAPAEVQGRNLLPSTDGENTLSVYAESFLPRLHFNWSELRGLETSRYHFIDAPKAELYDLEKDPGETQNLIGTKKAVGEEMRAKLSGTIRQYSAGPELAQRTGLDPALMERLKSLGYAGFSGGDNPTISDRGLPDPKDRIQVYELVSDAVADSQHGEYADSNAKLIQALKGDPESVPVHYLLGLNYYRQRDYVQAIDQLNKVLKLSPDYSLAVFQLGLAYAHNGEYDNAISALKRALQLDSSNYAASYNLGAAYVQKKMLPEATAAFQQTITLAPEYGAGHNALGQMLLYNGDYNNAVAEFHRAAELLPGQAGPHIALAKAYSAQGLERQAADEMRKAEQLQQESQP